MHLRCVDAELADHADDQLGEQAGPVRVEQADQRPTPAATVLRPLQEDLLAVRGESDVDLQDVRELLTRIRLMKGDDTHGR